MIRTQFNTLLVALGLIGAASLFAADPPEKTVPSEYRSVQNAITREVSKARPGEAGQTGYLGVSFQRDTRGRLVIEQVQPGSPAAIAGIKKGDVIARIGEQAVQTPDAFREWLQTRGPGESVKLSLLREDQPLDVSVTLTATSRPRVAGERRVYLGLELADAKEGEAVQVAQVAPDSPAAAAGFKTGDVVLKIDGAELTRSSRLADILAEKRPGDILAFAVRREGTEVVLKARLAAERTGGGRGGAGGGRGGDGAGRGGPGGGQGGGRGDGPPPTALWKQPIFRVAVIGIEFPDVKHNAKVPLKEWEEAILSRQTFHDKNNSTGQPVYGSLNDYFLEQSAGALRLEGTVFDWIEVGKKRGDYVQGSGTTNKTGVLVEALEKLVARDGKERLKDFDGLLFLYAGERVPGNRGSLYYPHAGSVNFQGNRFSYLVNAEGATRQTPVGAFAKEFGQVLGLPDLAARSENIGSEGLGVWCAMSNPITDSRPQHYSAWCKEKLGWIKPAVIDPTVKQKLVLAPIEDAPKECFKVLVRADGSEYFLLENRRKKGFDQGLPAEGLLIWRVVNDRPTLEEAHGVEGPTGPTVYLNDVPYPSPSNNAFTPETTPSSRSPRGGGLPVHLTNIRRVNDGSIMFSIGYEYR